MKSISLPINSTILDEIAKQNVSTNLKASGFANENLMVDYIKTRFASSQCNNSLLAGIVFDNSIANNINTATNLTYTIRLSNSPRRQKDVAPWNTKMTFAIQFVSGPINPDATDGGYPGYWREGFITIQKAIDVAIEKIVRNIAQDDTTGNLDGTLNDTIGNLTEMLAYTFLISRFPFPAYKNQIIEVGAFFLPVIVIFSFMTSVIYIVRSITSEKEDKIKEYMRVMGLSQWIHWVGHAVVNYAKLAFAVIVLSGLMIVITPKSDWSCMFVFYMIFAFDTMYIGFFISTFLQSATAGTLCAVMGWMVLYVWLAIYSSFELNAPFPLPTKVVNCLNPHIALYYGIQLIGQYETQANGLHWDMFFTPPTPDDKLTFGHAFIMLIVDGLILMLFTWYIEAVYPGGEGVAQPPYFMFLPSYWFPGTRSKKIDLNSQRATQRMVSWSGAGPKCEDEPTDMDPTINVVDLSKTYGSSLFKKLFDCKFGNSQVKTAVDGLSVKMYPGHITVLLGHNGAGKSTTFNILTGIIPPTQGTAYIDEYDIRNSLPNIRKQMGLCPQYNTLFNKLTVMEHLEFFCKLKNRVWDKNEALDLLNRLKIEFKANAYAGTLSGGQKRKLSLAIALIGGSEIVMLDEPTSGMDPGARHETWTLLQTEKVKRTMLLTTHFMEEADLLGDRIAIMAHGKLEACGSPMYLKSQYGDGYHLTVVYGNNGNHADTQGTLNLLQKHVQSAKMHSFVGQEGTFLLSASERDRFPTLFYDLEQNQHRFGIRSFGVSITTMEEVFLRVSDIAEERYLEDHLGETSPQMHELKADDPILQKLKARRKLTGFPYYMQHFHAMFAKRVIYFYRKWTIFITQMLFPIGYFALMIWTSTTMPLAKEQPPVTIDFWPFTNVKKNDPGYLISSRVSIDNVPLNQAVQNTLDNYNHPSNFYVKDVDNVTESILEMTNKLGSRTLGIHYPLAFDKTRTNVTVPYGGQNYSFSLEEPLKVYFNNFAFYSPALGTTFIDSLRLSNYTGKKYSISTINHPLPPTPEDTLKNQGISTGTAFLVAYAVIVGMSIMIAGYCQFIIRERKKKSKHMQMLSGLRPWMYWLCAFLWDYAFFVIRCIIFIAFYYIFSLTQYTNQFSTVATLFLGMLLYGWTAIPFTYWFSFLFTSAPKGFSLIVLFHIISGMIGSIAVPIIQQTSGDNPAYITSVVLSFFFPTYSIANLHTQVFMNELARQSCKSLVQFCSVQELESVSSVCCGDTKQYTDHILTDPGKRGILLNIIFFIVQGFIYWGLTFAVENSLFFNLRQKWKKNDKVVAKEKTLITPSWEANGSMKRRQTNVEDSDVIAEKEHVRSQSPSDTAVVAQDLVKWYGDFNAVKGVSFHVKSGECFGLLGVNGAGKTSCFQMLTGENPITSGNAYIKGWSVKTNWRQAGDNVGYCPQFDAIIREMSGEETLYMFARIRGIPPSEIPEKVDAVIKAIGIGMYAKRQIKTYSGGNKRRLSLGISLVGLPDVLLLDEPTTGVDPKARRIIWNILSRVRELGSALVLTSHSMDECEALCTELAIMVYGKFRCYGSIQHIKSRYGSGYTLIIRLRDKNFAMSTKDEIMKSFPGAMLKEEHVLQLNFELPKRQGSSWSSLFETLEKISKNLQFADYSLSQTTLEQVFIEFSRDAGVVSDPGESPPPSYTSNGNGEINGHAVYDVENHQASPNLRPQELSTDNFATNNRPSEPLDMHF
ncbi:hypothetical protein WR25_04476 isoform B [Diploscapter pachys]|uniref:ABC transporter domain-containing protein n=1 Tax=Diploscapter pachys TaxID=2018661 RepID=A0A2A2LFR4_9BILA|nr:hypothetical protein WR25_04476 isoform A [Diploscapter pachys]PAV85034.1 hypothetical protein WR25_04476 isoform B [Diploscapter pachys]